MSSAPISAAAAVAASSSSSTQSPSLVSSRPLEVKCVETFAYYACNLIDYNPKTKEVQVEYVKQWKPSEWISAENVRGAAATFDMAAFNPSPQTQVEAQAKSSDDEPFSWWKATIKTVRGEFYMISYSSWEDEFNEILEKDMLRPLNTAPSLAKQYEANGGLSKQEIPLPPEFRQGGVSIDHFGDIVKQSEVISLTVNFAPLNSIVVVGPPSSVKRATAMLAIALKHLVDIHKIQQKKQQQEEIIHNLKAKIADGHVEEFKTNPEFMGFVIGKGGNNIKKAENSPGVASVKLDPATGNIKITAKTAEDAAKARRILEFVEQKYPVKSRMVGRVVGKNWTAIKEIEQASGCVRIRIDEKQHADKSKRADDSDTDLILMGTREAVADGMMLLDTHITLLKKVTEASDAQREINTQLAELSIESGEGPSSAFSFRGQGRQVRGRGGYTRGRGGIFQREGGSAPPPTRSAGEEYNKNFPPVQRSHNGSNNNNSNNHNAHASSSSSSTGGETRHSFRRPPQTTSNSAQSSENNKQRNNNKNQQANATAVASLSSAPLPPGVTERIVPKGSNPSASAEQSKQWQRKEKNSEGKQEETPGTSAMSDEEAKYARAPRNQGGRGGRGGRGGGRGGKDDTPAAENQESKDGGNANAGRGGRGGKRQNNKPKDESSPSTAGDSAAASVAASAASGETAKAPNSAAEAAAGGNAKKGGNNNNNNRNSNKKKPEEKKNDSASAADAASAPPTSAAAAAAASPNSQKKQNNPRQGKKEQKYVPVKKEGEETQKDSATGSFLVPAASAAASPSTTPATSTPATTAAPAVVAPSAPATSSSTPAPAPVATTSTTN